MVGKLEKVIFSIRPPLLVVSFSKTTPNNLWWANWKKKLFQFAHHYLFFSFSKTTPNNLWWANWKQFFFLLLLMLLLLVLFWVPGIFGCRPQKCFSKCKKCSSKCPEHGKAFCGRAKTYAYAYVLAFNQRAQFIVLDEKQFRKLGNAINMGGSGGAVDPPRIWGSCLIQNNNLCPLVDSQNIWICICFRSSAECLSMFRALRGAFVALGKSFLGSAAKRQPQSKYNTTEWKTRKWTSPTNHKKPCGISGKASATNK